MKIGNAVRYVVNDWFYRFMLVVWIVVMAVYLYINIYLEEALVVSAIVFPVVAAIPVATMIPFLRSVGFSWEDKFSVLVVTMWLGIVIWFFAELVWCWYYNLYWGVGEPYPSVADVFYVVAYFPIIFGLSVYGYSIYKTIAPEISKKELIFGTVLSVVLGIIVAWLSWWMVVLSYEGEPIPFVELILNALYVGLDAILLVIVVFEVMVIKGRLGRVFMLFAVSMGLIVVYDLIYAYLDVTGALFDGHWSELLDLASYMVDAAAFYEISSLLE